MKKDKSTLKGKIFQAFPSLCSLSHSDCFELRTKLLLLRNEDVLVLLGPVLIDLRDTQATIAAAGAALEIAAGVGTAGAATVGGVTSTGCTAGWAVGAGGLGVVFP